MKKYSHLLFDFDRTLWDFDLNTEETFLELYDLHNLREHRISFAIFYEIYKAQNLKLWDQYREGKITKADLRKKRFYVTLLEFGIDDPARGVQMDKDYLAISATKKNLFPDTISTLQYLAPKYKLYILTNGFREVQEQKINACGLKSFFQHILISEDCGFMKPSGKIFTWAVEKAGTENQNCLMIGDDMDVDIKGAYNAGIDQVWFNPHGQKNNFQPTFEIRGLEELCKIL